MPLFLPPLGIERLQPRYTCMYMYNSSSSIKLTKNSLWSLHRSLNDSRFIDNESALQWLNDWHEDVKRTKGVTASQRNRMFLSEKTMFDVQSMVIGFKSFCKILFALYPGCEIKPSRTNQDRQELFFGRQRAQEGQNENPT